MPTTVYSCLLEADTCPWESEGDARRCVNPPSFTRFGVGGKCEYAGGVPGSGDAAEYGEYGEYGDPVVAAVAIVLDPALGERGGGPRLGERRGGGMGPKEACEKPSPTEEGVPGIGVGVMSPEPGALR